MPDPDLLSNNCDGETSTVQLGTAPASLTPNQRLGIVKRDNRTIVNDDAIPAPGNNGDLPGGIKVSICGENAEIPFAARTQDGNSGNMLRVQQENGGDPCGLTVLAPLIASLPNTTRVALAQNNNVDDDPAPIPAAAAMQQIVLSNPDSVERLYTIEGRISIITQINNDGSPAEGQFIARSTIIGAGSFVGGAAENARVVTMTYPSGNFGGRTLNTQFEFSDKIIVPAGGTRTIEYRMATIRTMNMLTPGSGPPPPFRGSNMAGVTIRSEQVRTS